MRKVSWAALVSLFIGISTFLTIGAIILLLRDGELLALPGLVISAIGTAVGFLLLVAFPYDVSWDSAGAGPAFAWSPQNYTMPLDQYIPDKKRSLKRSA